MKIIADKQDRRYEVTFLVSSIFSENETTQVKQAVIDVIGKLKGSVEIQEEWGKKQLAYPIQANGNSHREASYFYFEVMMDPSQVVNLSRELELHERVLRYLVVSSEPVASAEPAPAKEAESK